MTACLKRCARCRLTLPADEIERTYPNGSTVTQCGLVRRGDMLGLADDVTLACDWRAIDTTPRGPGRIAGPERAE